MIDHVLDRYSKIMRHVVVVVDPASRGLVAAHLDGRVPAVTLVEQASPTGMLDAVLVGHASVLTQAPDRVWITWCDQVGISARTVGALARLESESPDAAVIFPVVRQSPPYIHFDQAADGRITAVRQRREGDPMPDAGTSDAGLFSLSHEAFAELLPAFARTAPVGAGTSERNFLPFIPWIARTRPVLTFEIPSEEARGVNTPDDVLAAERWLISQAAAEAASS